MTAFLTMIVGRQLARGNGSSSREHIPFHEPDPYPPLFTKDSVMKIAAAALAASVLAFAMVGMNKSHTENVVAPVNISCGYAASSPFLDNVRVDLNAALGLILKNPQQLPTICKTLHKAAADAHQFNAARKSTKESKREANSTAVYTLQAAFGLSKQDSVVLVQQYAVANQAAKAVDPSITLSATSFKHVPDLATPAAAQAKAQSIAPNLDLTTSASNFSMGM